uniref:Uncharacterized protein n=1 Tax=Sphaerodactylus townsendi TaxID=933632 RepID=A0ACB8EUH6_9SAUR
MPANHNLEVFKAMSPRKGDFVAVAKSFGHLIGARDTATNREQHREGEVQPSGFGCEETSDRLLCGEREDFEESENKSSPVCSEMPEKSLQEAKEIWGQES